MIPKELKQHRQWVNWRTSRRNGKLTKMPVMPSGKAADTTDPTTWSAFDELSASGGKGFVFSRDECFIGVDLDGCRNPESGQLDQWAQQIVFRFATYTEVSPSGTGVKLFGFTDSVWDGRNSVDLPGDGHGGKKPGIEVYDNERYFAVTGNRIGQHLELVDVTDSLGWLKQTRDLEEARQGNSTTVGVKAIVRRSLQGGR